MDGPKPGDSLDDVMAHFGVKGMKWGVRKRSKDSDPSSPDAARAASSAAIIKTSGTKALSNKDLQDLVTRMNLERQFSTLSSQSKTENAGVKFAKELLIGVGKQQAQKYASDFAGKQIAKALAVKAAKVAVAAAL